MNAKARALGMTSTHFVEPTGLSSENTSTPEDLAKLVMAAAQSPVIRRYSTSRGFTIRSGRRMVAYRNTDRWWIGLPGTSWSRRPASPMPRAIVW